ncbi:CAP-Gly domain [Nesidiocoris tenuis]|uniref:CAP-Gly domain n=1 Tax=Nesidiocoris tenuis TaxID=355587 RepID=A0ABN7ANM8_9HEMI|nr:CAP-Gly domain [Nesidiocoris tenuis]
MEEYTVKTADFINVMISTSCESNCIEKRYHKGITVLELKGKLEVITGANAATMKIKVFSKTDELVCELSDGNALLGSYPIDDGMRLHVEDQFLLRKQLDEFQVEKFELSQEEYDKRSDTVRSFLKRNRLGKFDEEEMKKKQVEKEKEEELEKEHMKTITVGSRCQTQVPGQPTRRGAVKFVGSVKFSPGNWVGVQYDEPLGKNDGSVQGVRYFECPPKYGGFVKPLYVQVGDFPEEEINFDDDDEL